jgi:hypothetical protein
VAVNASLIDHDCDTAETLALGWQDDRSQAYPDRNTDLGAGDN